jgi:Domain of unknown function (DUF4376)
MFYKDLQNKLHSIDKLADAIYLPLGCVAITDVEAAAIRLAAIPVPTTDDMWQKIKAERDRRIQSGGYKVGTKWYHSDTFSRTQQMGLVMLGINIPANTPWKTMDGSFVGMTQVLAGQIFGTAAASDIAIFTAAETHNAAMRASALPHTYNYLSGWPVAYGE